MKTRIVYYFIGAVISALALTSVASLSAHAHETDNTLMAAQAQLQALQREHDQLKAEHETLGREYDQLEAEHESLGREYDQVKSDLDTANGKVASLEGELKTAKKQNDELGQTIKIARLNMSVLDGLFTDSTSLQEMNTRVTATGNSELSRRWDAINDQESLGNFIIYLIHITWDSLN